MQFVGEWDGSSILFSFIALSPPQDWTTSGGVDAQGGFGIGWAALTGSFSGGETQHCPLAKSAAAPRQTRQGRVQTGMGEPGKAW